MHFWLGGAQHHPQPVEPFVRSIEPPVRAENDAISPLTRDRFVAFHLQQVGSDPPEIRGTFT